MFSLIEYLKLLMSDKMNQMIYKLNIEKRVLAAPPYSRSKFGRDVEITIAATDCARNQLVLTGTYVSICVCYKVGM